MKTKSSQDVLAGIAEIIPLARRREIRTPMHARLEALFREHEAKLLRFLTVRLGSVPDARDCLQIVFARLLERDAQLADENLVALLYVCARNVATDELRRRRQAGTYVDVAGESQIEGLEIADESPSLDRQTQATQELDLLMSLLEELPPKCRSAFVGYKLEGLEYRDIALRMGITESMVRKYVIKAVAYCAARFEELQGWE
jgi:RNA polymerase sigma-70 factor (ECF subfamily)